MRKNMFRSRLGLTLVLCICGVSLLSAQQQKEWSLAQLQNAAKAYYPLLKQNDIYKQIADTRSSSVRTNFLPQASISGQATYQSEVTELKIPIPGAAGFSQKPDQYSIGLELKQNLFDYGAVRTQVAIEQTGAAQQAEQLAIEYQKIKDRINQLYGTINLQLENKKILQLRLNELEAKIKKMQAAVDAGAALKSNLLLLSSEQLATLQKMEEANSNLNTWYNVLSLLTNQRIDTTCVFTDLQRAVPLASTAVRAEYRLFDLQTHTLQLKEKMIAKTNLPKVYVFGRGYYGRPGFNFLNNSFRPYGMVGAGLAWNLTNYYTANKDNKVLQLNTQLLQNQKSIFAINLESTLSQQRAEITKLERLLVLDAQIVAAKTSIRAVSSSQLDNGVITPADYLVDLNAENQAQFNLKLHEIQLLMAKENYNNTLGY